MNRWHATFNRYFRDRNGRIVLGQRPNLPIIIWAVAWLLQWPLSGRPAQYAWVAGTVALVVWAVLELGWGVTYFRRTLGLIVLVYVMVRIVR